MKTRPIQIDEVVYNASTQSFDALVTVHDGPLTRKYACAIQAPISMSFEVAAAGLTTQALRLHATKRGTYSETKRYALPALATAKNADPIKWLSQFMPMPGQRAA